MSDWICPDCDGGYPEPVEGHKYYKCPYCGYDLAKWSNISKKRIEDIIE